MISKNKKYEKLLDIFIVLLPIAAGILCIGIGRYHLSPVQSIEVLLKSLIGEEVETMARSVVINVRLPRILLALSVGSGLAVSGTSFQALFSNPLATPDTLGVATGASFGAVLALLISDNLLTVQLFALAMGLAALFITCIISKMNGRTSMIMVVLAGMVVSSLFEALVSFMKYGADPEEELPTITYWLMGSMSKASLTGIVYGIPLIMIGITILYLLRWRLNILSLNEDEAKSLGVNVKRLRLIVMTASTLVTASSVSMCGQVGWVGLLIPHGARMIYGSDNRKVVPVSICLGGAFMVIIDTAARAATAAEIPISILTALIGAPFFIILLRKTGGAKL